jgi:uncharacterized protein (DUF2062 family)
MPETRWARLKEILFHHHVEPLRLAFAVALGVFIGMTPFFGVQTILAIALAGLLRLNITAVVLATQVSNPLFAPFIVAASVWIGDKLGAPAVAMDGSWWDLRHERFYESWLKGGLVLGLAAGLLCGAITWAVAARMRRRSRHA